MSQVILEALDLTQPLWGACTGPGEWLKNKGTKALASMNPATTDTIATLQTSDQNDYETVISRAQQQFLKWRLVPAPQRGELVRLLGQVLRQQKDALGSLVALEMGKSKQEGDGEVQEMIDIADFAVGQSRMLYGNTMHSERPQHRLYEQWHPLGVTGIISAFNFPVAVWAWNACLAVICGNTVVWKPSSKTPLCALAVQNCCNQVMAEVGVTGVFNCIIPEAQTITTQLVNDKRIPLISFTGSTPTGRQVAAQVAQRLGRSILELGGNNAIIIDETADLTLAIPAIVFGAVGTAGQRCTTTRRLLIQNDCFERVVAQLIHAYQQIKMGDPLNPDNQMGPLIDAAAVAAFQETLAQAKALGGEILYGGDILERPGYFVQPTIVRAHNDWPCVQKETFAPILYVMPYQDLADAIAQQNAVDQGLSSALFTSRLSHSEYFLASCGSDCGIANVNIGTSGAEIGGAFGGEKDTGGGRESGSDAWKGYMRRQTNTINWGNALPLAQGIRFDLGEQCD